MILMKPCKVQVCITKLDKQPKRPENNGREQLSPFQPSPCLYSCSPVCSAVLCDGLLFSLIIRVVVEETREKHLTKFFRVTVAERRTVDRIDECPSILLLIVCWGRLVSAMISKSIWSLMALHSAETLHQILLHLFLEGFCRTK